MQKQSSEENSIPGDYQYIAITQGSLIQRQWHKNRHNLIKYLDFLKKEDIVLDIGCGSGNVIYNFSSKIKQVVGVDKNRECIAYIKKKLKKDNIKNASAIEMDILSLNLKNKNFTKVVMTETIEHFSEDDIRKILKNIKKILTSNGKVFITTPNYKSPWLIIEKLIDFLKLSPKLWGEQHIIKFTQNKLIKILKDEGFIIEKRGTLNGISPFIAPLDSRLADKISYFEFKYLSFGNLLYVVATLNKN